ncbi:MAG: hypothetical protein ACREOE_01160, partial [Gemmatimonadales bacterium]
MTEHTTRAALGALAAPLRRGALLTVGAMAVAALALLVSTASWAFRLGVATGPLWVLATWSLAIIVVIGAAWGVQRRLRSAGRMEIAALLEGTGGWRRGALASLVGSPAQG